MVHLESRRGVFLKRENQKRLETPRRHMRSKSLEPSELIKFLSFFNAYSVNPLKTEHTDHL